MERKIFLVYIDILGFEELPKQLAEESVSLAEDLNVAVLRVLEKRGPLLKYENLKEDLPKEITKRTIVTSEKARKNLIKTINEKIQELEKKGLLLRKREASIDSWLLYVDSVQKVLECIQKVVEAERPVEIAVGAIKVEDPTKYLESEASEYKNGTIATLKETGALLDAYKSLYKNENKTAIKQTFVIFTKEAYEDLGISCRKVIYNRDGKELYVLRGDFKDTIWIQKIIEQISKERGKTREIISGVIINPEVFENLALRKVYGFMKVENYWELKEKMQEFFKQNEDATIGVHGIYGYHDIIIQSYEPESEDPKTRLELRLWPIINNEDYFKPEYFGWAEVKGIIKHHGIQIKNGFRSILWSVADLDRYKKFFGPIITHETIDDSALREMVDKNILFETQYDQSDITNEERKRGETEFLVLVEVKEGMRSSSVKHPETTFEELILKNLLNDQDVGPMVRTVEKIEPCKESFIKGNFILHVVGRLDDLNEIVLKKIHKESTKYNEIQCKTQVIIPAEPIVKNKLPVLLERSLPPIKARRILEIITQCKTKINDEYVIPPSEFIYPFAFSMVDEPYGDKIIEVYEKFYVLIDVYYGGDKHLLAEMLRFLYGITEAFVLDEEEKIESCKTFKDRRSILVKNIGEKIEESLSQVFDRVIKSCSLSENEFNELLNLAIRIKMGRMGDFNCKEVSIGKTAMALRAVEGVFLDGRKEEKAVKKAESVIGVEKAKQKIDKLNELYTEFKKWFAPVISQEIYKKLTGITVGNLEGIANVRNLFSPAGRSEEAKILEISSKLPDILQGVRQGIRYLEHINTRFNEIDRGPS